VKKDTFTVLLLVSTLFLDKLWKLWPDSTVVFKKFPYSDTLITNQTYVWMIFLNVILLIYIHSWYYKFDEYRVIFGAWFCLQFLQLIEFFLTYNEALAHIEVSGFLIGINVMNIKYAVIFSLTLHKLWSN